MVFRYKALRDTVERKGHDFLELEFRLSILFGGQSSANALHSIRGEKEEEKSITFL